MVEPEALIRCIETELEGVVHVDVRDLTGTKDHYQATVVAKAFEGKNRVEQHQLVYAALGDLMKGPVHALALTTLTESQWDAATSPK